MVELSPIQKIEGVLATNKKGLSIQQIVDETKLSRGTVKTYLDELIRMSRVHEEEYGPNTKVYFLNGKGMFQTPVKMYDKGYDKGVLFVDVMTDPWMNPFIRVKFRRKNNDIGSIFINNEESVDELIKALEQAKPHLKKYREMVNKIKQQEA
jgi:predicted ArsR family transcriptional regulator